MFGDDFQISRLAVPAVSILISFLAYTSQYFFLHFEKVPLRKDEVWKINIFALCIWVCYLRSCFVDPGRLLASQKAANTSPEEKAKATRRQRWCRRCEAYKPPRAHHCKTCQRLVSKWVGNLVFTDLCTGAFPRWTTTAHGHRTVYHILPFRTFSASCSLPLSAWATSKL